MIVQELVTKDKLAMFAVSGAKAAPKFDGVAYAKELPGVTEPLGFWDPLGFCSDEKLTEGKLKFYREVELKHGRVGMLAALGFVVAENFHPLFGGDIDAPAYLAFQQDSIANFLACCGDCDCHTRSLLSLQLQLACWWRALVDSFRSRSRRLGLRSFELEANRSRRTQDHANERAQQWPPRDARCRWHDSAGVRNRSETLLGN